MKKIDLNNITVKDAIRMLSPDFDPTSDIENWQEDDDLPDIRGVVNSFATCGEIDDFDVPLYGCGSCSVVDTPKALYRLLYMFRPTNVYFDEMYKSRLFIIVSETKRFAVLVELFKYKLGLYFACPGPALTGTNKTGIRADHPGADNLITCGSEEGLEFFELVKAVANNEILVRGGGFLV